MTQSMLLLPFVALLALTPLAAGQTEKPPYPSPNDIVAQAKPAEWVDINLQDLLIMTLSDDRDDNPRHVTIQLMPAPFSQGWVGNIRKLAMAQFWDGTSINRVQDNYVVQWGDASAQKPLPKDLNIISEGDYVTPISDDMVVDGIATQILAQASNDAYFPTNGTDPYIGETSFMSGWPFGFADNGVFPIHCYAMVGVGRNLPPNTGSGAELYAVIGHAPRHLDRNIALVGRVIEGIEHLSSLPRGTGPLGFYADASKRVPIQSIQLATALPDAKKPAFEYLDTDSTTFARYAEAAPIAAIRFSSSPQAGRISAIFQYPCDASPLTRVPGGEQA